MSDSQRGNTIARPLYRLKQLSHMAKGFRLAGVLSWGSSLQSEQAESSNSARGLKARTYLEEKPRRGPDQRGYLRAVVDGNVYGFGILVYTLHDSVEPVSEENEFTGAVFVRPFLFVSIVPSLLCLIESGKDAFAR